MRITRGRLKTLIEVYLSEQEAEEADTVSLDDTLNILDEVEPEEEETGDAEPEEGESPEEPTAEEDTVEPEEDAEEEPEVEPEEEDTGGDAEPEEEPEPEPEEERFSSLTKLTGTLAEQVEKYGYIIQEGVDYEIVFPEGENPLTIKFFKTDNDGKKTDITADMLKTKRAQSDALLGAMYHALSELKKSGSKYYEEAKATFAKMVGKEDDPDYVENNYQLAQKASNLKDLSKKV